MLAWFNIGHTCDFKSWDASLSTGWGCNALCESSVADSGVRNGRGSPCRGVRNGRIRAVVSSPSGGGGGGKRDGGGDLVLLADLKQRWPAASPKQL